MMNKSELICITSGEPAGIGPEICLDLASSSYNQSQILLLIGDEKLLQQRAQVTGKQINLIKVSREQLATLTPAPRGSLYLLACHCPQPECMGQPRVANSRYVLNTLDVAIKLCQTGLSRIIVTAPVNKDIINQAGYAFSGHTEYLAAQFGVSKVVMMLANPLLKVALLTTHLPLAQVAAQVTSSNLQQTLTIIHHDFATKFGLKRPRIAVCGLNPHAGENGYLGREELDIINPVIRQWQTQGYAVSGCYPADTIFNQAPNFDLILAMYHDQGLPVIKYSDFEHGVNVTLGLPIIRTSVDHGTALNLAGTGRASSQSLIAAVEFACNYAANINQLTQ